MSNNNEPKNQIVLFYNERCESNEKAPEYQGKVTMADGTEFEVAVWRRVSEKTGNEFYSGLLKLPENKPQGRGRPMAGQATSRRPVGRPQQGTQQEF